MFTFSDFFSGVVVEPSHGVMNAKTTSERPKGYTALHFLAQAKSQHDDGDERVKIATRLLDLGADPDSLDFRLNPPIFFAAGVSFLEMAKLLHKESELDFEAYQNEDERTLADMVKTPNGKVLRTW